MVEKSWISKGTNIKHNKRFSIEIYNFADLILGYNGHSWNTIGLTITFICCTKDKVDFYIKLSTSFGL